MTKKFNFTPGLLSQLLHRQQEPLCSKHGVLSTDTLDDLFEKAIALSDGNNKFVIASFDLIGFTDPLVTSICKAVFDSSWIKADHLILACTHNHNSPNSFDVKHGLPEDLVKGKTDRDIQWENKIIPIIASTDTRPQFIPGMSFSSAVSTGTLYFLFSSNEG